MFQMVEEARQNQNNTMELLKKVTGNYTPEQLDGFYSQVEKMGFSTDVINQIKDGINAK